MQSLIPIVNRLQDVVASVGTDELDLPQVVVVGGQSSGKSSVLEAIVGRDLLPRGAGIVTRRPLILQLINIPAVGGSSDAPEEWGEFLHKPKQNIYDFEEIKREIQAETDRLTGKNKGISSKPINLKIFSPHVLNLTLVDLPGLTKVPVGDQPADIERQIRDMVMSFVEKKNAIIVAVTPANTDVATSDALQLAKQVDPLGSRTLGVLTKIDIMDKGTNCMDVILGKQYPLKLGYIGVVNRSQQAIIRNKDIRTARQEETRFFSEHPVYKGIANRMGTAFLAKTLNKILMHHIRDVLPELKLKVNKMMTDAQAELMRYGDGFSESANVMGATLLQIITKFSADYRDTIDGKITSAVDEVYGGARINFIFAEIYQKCLDDINPTNGLTEDSIRTAIRNATGTRAALFIPEDSFEILVKRQIARLEEPSLQAVGLVFDELQRIVSQVETPELARFTNLRDRLVEVVNNLLVKCREPTLKMVHDLINIELSYINTNHPDFIGGGGALSHFFQKLNPGAPDEQQQQQQQQQLQQQQQQSGIPQRHGASPNARATQPAAAKPAKRGAFGSFFGKGKGKGPAKTGHQGPPGRLGQVPTTLRTGQASDKERFEVELIRDLMDSYFDIVRKNIMDTVPKTVMYFLVNESKNSIQNELVAQLYKEEMFADLLEESPQIAARRESCQQTLKLLRQAHTILNEVRDYNPTSF